MSHIPLPVSGSPLAAWTPTLIRDMHSFTELKLDHEQIPIPIPLTNWFRNSGTNSTLSP